jgi:Tol biopolymer transport system component
MLRTLCQSVVLSGLALATTLGMAASRAALADEPRLLIAFASYRERPQHPQIYFYEHDGVAIGKLIEGIPTIAKRSDNHPALSREGRFCAFASEVENETSRILLWDRTDKKLVELTGVNESPNAQLWPTLSGDARSLAFAAWNRPNSSQRWDLFLVDLTGRRFANLPEVNTQLFDERMPAVSGDGQFLAYVTNGPGAGLMDVALFDLKTRQLVALPGVNSEHREVEPALSGDGRRLAFVSDRPGGAGARDIYLYDRQAGGLVDLPGLNSVGQEQSPSLSADGRYLAFVSERIRGEGERDIYLYDVDERKLLPTPNLNARQEDFDPCVIGL